MFVCNCSTELELTGSRERSGICPLSGETRVSHSIKPSFSRPGIALPSMISTQPRLHLHLPLQNRAGRKTNAGSHFFDFLFISLTTGWYSLFIQNRKEKEKDDTLSS